MYKYPNKMEFSNWRKTGQIVNDDIVGFMTRHTAEVRSLNYDEKETSEYIDDKVRIVLNTIMKNEHAVMERCIRSTLPLVDAICYSDTGSSGDVFEILRKIVPNYMPPSIEIEPWQNFGYNRTVGLQQTERFVQRMKWNPEKTYVLCIDADMMLKISPLFSKESLTNGSYAIRQHNGSFVYWNTRLMRVSNHWFVVGRTHEYYNAKTFSYPENLSSLYIEDISDGANRTDKFDRDIILLMEDLADDPKNARAMFYLAESFRNRAKSEYNDYEKAIQYYNKHLITGSWPEEMWFSMYMIGMCYELIGDVPKMLKAYLDAYQNRPHRAEPLFRIGKFYRNRSEYHTAILFLKLAADIPFPSQDILFVEKDIYDFNILFEMTVCCHLVGDLKRGHYCLQKLLRQKNIPLYWRDLTLYNARFFIQPLHNTEVADLCPVTLSTPYVPCNPSIVLRRNELAIICRSVNYTQQCARGHKVVDNTGIFNSRNCLMNLRVVDFHKLNTYALDYEMQIQIKSNACGAFQKTCKNRGLEDARLINMGKNLAFSCTSLEFTKTNEPRMVWVELTENEKGCTVEKLSLITGYGDHKPQKNWLPFVWKNETDDAKSEQNIIDKNDSNEDNIYFVYDYEDDKMTILKFDPIASTVKLHLQTDLPVHSSGWRGSSGPVKIPNQGWLLLIHEVCDRPEHRFYMHRFVLMNNDFTELRGLSDLFYFQHGRGVEMATGMVYVDGELLITIGIEDSRAVLLKTSYENVRNLMNI